MIKKIVLTAAVAAFAVSFAPSASFAKKMHKHHAHKCTMGHMVTGKPNSMGWAHVMGCGADGKMYMMPAMCYTASKMCPKG